MRLYQLNVPKDDAWNVMNEFGDVGKAHFIDLNKVLVSKYGIYPFQNSDELDAGLTIPYKELTAIRNEISIILNTNAPIHPEVTLPPLTKHQKPQTDGLKKADLSILICDEADVTLADETDADIYFKLPDAYKRDCTKYIDFLNQNPRLIPWFPPVLIGKDGVKEMIGDGVDLLFCNEQEAKLYADTDSLDDAIDAIKKVAKTFAITLGSKGALAFDGETLHEIAPNAVTAVDSNGAGDMFAGAFLYAITHGHDFAAAGRLASAASSKVVSQFGPRLDAEQHEPLKSVL